MKLEMTEGLCRTLFPFGTNSSFIISFPNKTLFLNSSFIKSCRIKCFCPKYTNNSLSRKDIFMQKQTKFSFEQFQHHIMPNEMFLSKIFQQQSWLLNSSLIESCKPKHFFRPYSQNGNRSCNVNKIFLFSFVLYFHFCVETSQISVRN